MAVDRLVVIGADAAGMSAASQARRRRDADDLRIDAFDRGTTPSYSACGIPYWIGGEVAAREDLVVRDAATFRDRYAIDVHLRHEVTAIDTAARTIRVCDLDADGGEAERTESYDELVIATGAVPVRPPVPGVAAPGVFGVQTLDDGTAVLDHLQRHQPRRAVVVGGGYIGLEMAEALRHRDLDVTLIDSGAQPMSTLDPDLGELVATALRDGGVRVESGRRVDAIEVGDDGRVRGVRAGDLHVPAEIVILGTGARPASALAVEAGVPIGARGGIVVDDRQRTEVDGVWAAGDCTQVHHRVSGQPTAIALGTIANKTGRVAGVNLGGGDLTFPGVLGTAVSKICGVEIGRTGLGEAEAARHGFDVTATTVRSSTRAGYYPGSSAITVKVIVDDATGRLLGAQLVGGLGSAKRIDTFAVAIWNEMTVEELHQVDLSYAPPFSPVWDPVLITARKAAEGRG